MRRLPCRSLSTAAEHTRRRDWLRQHGGGVVSLSIDSDARLAYIEVSNPTSRNALSGKMMVRKPASLFISPVLTAYFTQHGMGTEGVRYKGALDECSACMFTAAYAHYPLLPPLFCRLSLATYCQSAFTRDGTCLRQYVLLQCVPCFSH